MALNIPDEVDEWFDQLTADELEDVSRTIADMAENRRRVEQLQENEEDDTDEGIMQERPRDLHGDETQTLSTIELDPECYNGGEDFHERSAPTYHIVVSNYC